jgi:hypothetical protein
MEASSSKKSLTSTKLAADPLDIKGLVNSIFEKKGAEKVKNFPKEFADGSNSSYCIDNDFSSFPRIVQHFIRRKS